MTAAERLIATAESQVGYQGKKTNSQLDDFKANTPGKYNKYARDLDALGDFYNGKKNGYDWCDVFVDWCFVHTFGRQTAQKLLCQPDKSLGAGTGYSLNYYKQKGQFFSTPQPGDQIFFGDSKTTWHTGIVVKVSGGFVHTVEGNAGNPSAVRSCRYVIGGNIIKGYGRPDWKIVQEDKPTKPTLSKAERYDKTKAGTYLVTPSEGLNIRAGAGTQNPSLGLLSKGTRVICYGYYSTIVGIDWLLVAANGVTGYVSSAYLQADDSGGTDNKEDDETMTYEQWKTYMDRYRMELAAMPVSDWAVDEFKAAEDTGITDGTRPRSFVTREEAAIMVFRGKNG